MASISKRSFLFTDKNLLTLANEEWCRTLPNGNNWVRIRLGFLAAVSSNSTRNITDAACFFGLCAGKTAPSSAWNAQNFVGVSLIGGAAPLSTRTLTYGSATNPYYSATTGQIFRRFNQTITASNFGSSAAAFVPAAVGTQRRRVPFIIDIQRQTGGGGLYTFFVYGVQANVTTAFDFRPDHLLDMVDQLGTPASFSQTMTVLGSNQTINVSEVEGGFDTICLYWGRQAYPLEVYAIAASISTDAPYPSAAWGGATENFDSYQVGSVVPSAGTLNAGNGWTSTWVVSGTSMGTSQFGLAGTTTGAYDSFDSYSVGTFLPNMRKGSNWAGTYSLTGTWPNLDAQVGYAGTSAGMPYDTAGSYAITSGSLVTLDKGIGFASPGTVATYTGTTYYNLTPQSGYAGTSCSFPYDDFESYSVGAVVSGVTINAGTSWIGNGIIN